MENKLQQFHSEEFGKVRVLEIEGQPWFIGKDVTDILKYCNGRDALRVHVDDEDKADVVIHDGSQNRKYAVINESGLYSLILSSKLPTAKKFKRWVTSEILPSLRRHGAYITPEVIEQMLSSSDFSQVMLETLLEEQAENDRLRERLDAALPKARYCELLLQCPQVVPVSIIAKDYGMSAVAFNQLLHRLGIQYRVGGTWLPYQRYADQGYTRTRTYYINETAASTRTYWTQAGRLFLYETLRECGILPGMSRLPYSEEADS